MLFHVTTFSQSQARRQRGPVLSQTLFIQILTTFLVLLATLSATAQESVGSAEQAREIMDKNFAATRVRDSIASATFTLTNRDGAARVRQTQGWTKLRTNGRDHNGRDNMRLVRFNAPADIKGTATLMLENSGAEDDLWVYLPALGKVRRLSASNKKEGFVGTDFSYGDIIGHRPEDWTHRVLREEAVEGQACVVVESVPANDTVRQTSGYSKRVNWVRKDNFVAIRGEVFDLNGTLAKRLSAGDIRQVSGSGAQARWQPMVSTAENLATGHRTEIRFESFKADQNVADSLFTSRELER